VQQPKGQAKPGQKTTLVERLFGTAKTGTAHKPATAQAAAAPAQTVAPKDARRQAVQRRLVLRRTLSAALSAGSPRQSANHC